MRELFATTALLALVAATPALAQDATPPAGSDAKPHTESASPTARSDTDSPQTAVGDIVVTARRRAESIRDIPGTISAVTAAQLNGLGPVASTGDLLASIPGVRFNDVASANLAEVSIRGSGTERATGADSGVGLFVNGAYVGSSTLGGRNFKTLDYFDLERVEALEGPQGALYGRNSEYGVVNIVLAKPEFKDSGYVRDTFTAETNQNRLAGVVNQKLSDDLAVRVGAETYGQTKGFYYDPNNNRYYDRTSGWTARGQVRYRHGPLDVNVLVDAQDLDLPTFVNTYVTPPGVIAQLPLGFIQPRFTVPHSGKDGVNQQVQRVMLTGNYDFDWGTLTSTTMFMHWRSRQQFAAAFDLATEAALQAQKQTGLYPYGQNTSDVSDRTLYQDVHLTGKALGGRLSWTVGGEGLFQRDTTITTAATSPCTFALGAGICSGTPTQPICVKPLPTSANCPAVFPNAFGTNSQTRQRFSSIAAYASLIYTLGNFSIAGEGRFSHDNKSATQTIYKLYTTSYVKVPTTFRFNANEPSYTVTLSYKIPGSLGTLLYAKVGTGYRAGGVNNGVSIPVAPNPLQFTYDNETTIGYEAGVKTNLARNIYARVSAYLSRTNDAITSVTDGCLATNACGQGPTAFNVNAGRIHAKGIEASLDGRFSIAEGQLTMALNVANQQAMFVEPPAGTAGLPLRDSKVAQIPSWTMSANAGYNHRITDNLDGFLNFQYQGQRGGVQDSVTAIAPLIPLSDFDNFDLSVGANYRKIQLSLFVHNLTNQTIQLLKFQQNGSPLSARFNQPRTVGASMSYRW